MPLVSESWGGTGSGWGNPVVGGTALRIPAINSPNFNLANPGASPSPSWAILQSGLAYFFGLVLTGGTIVGPDYIINTSGAFFYSGTPAADNLSASIVPGAVFVTDPLGNQAYPGTATYGHAPGGGYLSFTQFENAITVRFGLSMTAWLSAFTVSDWTPTIAANVITGMTTTVGGPVLIDPGFTAITLDANWSTLAGQPVPSYMKTNDGFVHLSGAIQFNVNIANNNINGGHPLPGTAPGNGYRPSTEFFIAGAPGAAGVTIQTNGVLVAAQAPGQTTVFCNFNGRYPLNL